MFLSSSLRTKKEISIVVAVTMAVLLIKLRDVREDEGTAYLFSTNRKPRGCTPQLEGTTKRRI